MLDSITIEGKRYCRLLIANDRYGTPGVIKIGDAFFKAFNAIFDVNNQRLGLALNRFGLPGNRIHKNWKKKAEDYAVVEVEEVEEPEPTTDPIIDPSDEETKPEQESEETGETSGEEG